VRPTLPQKNLFHFNQIEVLARFFWGV